MSRFDRQAIDQSNEPSYLEVGSGLVILMAKTSACLQHKFSACIPPVHDIGNSHDGNTSVLRPSIALPKPRGSAHGSRGVQHGPPLTEAPTFAMYCKIRHYDIVPRLIPNHKPVKRMRLF